jgi:hypothetical protein
MTGKPTLDELLTAHPADSGCEEGFEVLHVYVELELAGEDAAARYPGVAAHLRSCPACRIDHEGLLEAIRADGALTRATRS